ncbi:MAG: DUF3800 domain-containing protein, partial [Prosthecobacter sp.]|nr:DUF3800 domain-containing protein [Prosthecobacter sp.]
DGSGSAKFRQELTTEIRRRLQDPEVLGGPIHKIKLQESHRNNLLQLADMVCGAVARSLTDKPHAGLCRKLISHCEMTVVHWPK